MSVLCVASGGALGTLLRYLIASFMPSENFPWHTLSVNLLGCLIMGLFAGWIFKFPVGEEARLFVMTGFLGALTTFSSFALDVGVLAEKGELVKASLYVALSVIACVFLFLRRSRRVRRFFKTAFPLFAKTSSVCGYIRRRFYGRRS